MTKPPFRWETEAATAEGLAEQPSQACELPMTSVKHERQTVKLPAQAVP